MPRCSSPRGAASLSTIAACPSRSRPPCFGSRTSSCCHRRPSSSSRRRRQERPRHVPARGTAGGERAAVLAQAVEQPAPAHAGFRLGPEEGRGQFQGFGERRVWDLCDRALARELPAALVTLRSLLAANEDPLLILGGIASRLRDLIHVGSLPERMPAAEVARAANLRFDWQVRRYREQARR